MRENCFRQRSKAGEGDAGAVELPRPDVGGLKPEQLRNGPLAIRSSLESHYQDRPIAGEDKLLYECASLARVRE